MENRYENLQCQNGLIQKIFIPYHRRHESFNSPPPPLAFRNSKVLYFYLPPCPLNSEIVNPSFPPEFPIVFTDSLEFLFDCLKLLTNGKPTCFFPPPRKFYSQFSVKQKAIQVCQCLIQCTIAFPFKCYLEVAYHKIKLFCSQFISFLLSGESIIF